MGIINPAVESSVDIFHFAEQSEISSAFPQSIGLQNEHHFIGTQPPTLPSQAVAFQVQWLPHRPVLHQTQYGVDKFPYPTQSPFVEVLDTTQPSTAAMNHSPSFEVSSYQLSNLMNRRRIASASNSALRPESTNGHRKDQLWDIVDRTEKMSGPTVVCSLHELPSMIEEAAETWRHDAENALADAATHQRRQQQVLEEHSVHVWYKSRRQTTFTASDDEKEQIVVPPMMSHMPLIKNSEQTGQTEVPPGYCELGVARTQPLYKIRGPKQLPVPSAAVKTSMRPARCCMLSTHQPSNEIAMNHYRKDERPTRPSMSSEITTSSVLSSTTIDSNNSQYSAGQGSSISRDSLVHVTEDCRASASLPPLPDLCASSSQQFLDHKMIPFNSNSRSTPIPSREFDSPSLQQLRMWRQYRVSHADEALLPRRIQSTPTLQGISSSTTLAPTSTTELVGKDGRLPTSVLERPPVVSTPYRSSRARVWLEQRAEAEAG